MRTTRRTIRAALTTGRTLAAAARGPLSLLRHAIEAHLVMRIAYVKEDGTPSVRTITPDKVWRSKAGDWCVRAHDALRDAGRTFRVDRITTLETA